jgi:hypothetical protein
MEIWLRANVRPLAYGAVLALAATLAGGLMASGLPGLRPPLWLRVAGLLVALPSVVALVALVAQLRRPRLAYASGQLLVWLRGAAPIRVPIEAVECFWLGQTSSLLPGKNQSAEVAAVIVRIAERAAEWRHQEVTPRLGSWCEGYVTIRGTWCEPLDIEVVNRLNARLAEVTRATSGESTRR